MMVCTYRGRRVVILREGYEFGLTLVAFPAPTAPPPLATHETPTDSPMERWVPTGEVIVMVTAEKEPQPA